MSEYFSEFCSKILLYEKLQAGPQVQHRTIRFSNVQIYHSTTRFVSRPCIYRMQSFQPFLKHATKLVLKRVICAVCTFLDWAPMRVSSWLKGCTCVSTDIWNPNNNFNYIITVAIWTKLVTSKPQPYSYSWAVVGPKVTSNRRWHPPPVSLVAWLRPWHQVSANFQP